MAKSEQFATLKTVIWTAEQWARVTIYLALATKFFSSKILGVRQRKS